MLARIGVQLVQVAPSGVSREPVVQMSDPEAARAHAASPVSALFDVTGALVGTLPRA